MNIVDTENCLFFDEGPETIEHIYLQCRNSIKIWNDTIFWVRSIWDHHFIISDHENIFGGPINSQVLNLIIISVKDVIYQKRRNGKEIMITDVKKCLLKNLNVIKAKETFSDNTIAFEENWNLFIQGFRRDIHTRNSWYII